MRRFEYKREQKVIECLIGEHVDTRREEFVAWLNDLGREGWELVHLDYRVEEEPHWRMYESKKNCDLVYTCFFKRETEEAGYR